jgi:glycerol-3-phosphate O-acyltransferase
MDVLGNYVDADGRSFDQYGNEINLEEYFYTAGKVTKNLQRESEYTKRLGERIVERYFKDNIVLTSHLVAFAAFQIVKNKNSRLDLYGILRLPADDYVFPRATMREVVGQLRQRLIDMADAGEVKLSEQVMYDVDQLIEDGISRLGTYHIAKPLRFNKKGQIISESFKVLYFYHNRLTGYGLEEKVQWKQFDLEMV